MGESSYSIYRSSILDELMNITYVMYLRFNRNGMHVVKKGEARDILPESVGNALAINGGKINKKDFRNPGNISGISTDTIIEVVLRKNYTAQAYWDWQSKTIVIRTNDDFRLGELACLCKIVKQAEREFLKAYTVSGERITFAEIERT